MTTVCFILNSIYGVHGIRRVEDFIKHGFNVKVFGFDRGENSKTKQLSYRIEVLETINNSLSYVARIPLLKRGIQKAKKMVGSEKVVWYYMGMDIALAGRFYNGKAPYIYEEADLVYTYLKNKFLKFVFKFLDKKLISDSLKTILTSEGFVQFLFENKQPKNVSVVTNRLANEVLTLPTLSSHTINKDTLTFGFVGGVRFKSICSVINTIVKHFPQHKVVVYGTIEECLYPQIEELIKNYQNFAFLGRFTNPYDLPTIYQSIDLVISTYDVEFDNVKYAEPNKLYEAIYFEKPIIATKGTFLASKIEKLGVGFAINPFDKEGIMRFVNGITETSLQNCKENAKKLGKKYCINDNTRFFEDLKKSVAHL